MCGILGKVTFKGAHEAPTVFDQALGQLRHRGPDDQGAHHGQGPEGCRVSMGQTRLSILDLSSAGHQPMFSPRTGSCVVYNGEIYNFREIRATLETKGYKFTSECDTEVVLAAYDEYGEDFVTHFVGMFAIGLWDKPRGRLVLARDRLGIKPLYYYWDQNQLAFGSEVTALAALPGLRLNVSDAVIGEFLLFGYIPHPLSIFERTHKLPAGHLMTIDLARPRVESRAYWDALQYYLTPKSYTEEEAIDALESALLDAVRLRLISDVPLGAFLSGGVDSSLVVALMKKVHTGTVRTFTIGFSVPTWDEAPHARRIAQHIGTQHEEVYLTEDNVLSAAREVGDYYDEPFADSSNIPTLALARMTRRHVTVALSGDGGDELFWGYSSYTNRAYDVFERLEPMPRAMRRMIGAAMRAVPGRRWRPWGERLRHDDFAGYAMLPNIWLTWEYPGLHRRTAGSESRVMQIAREVQARLPGAPRDVLTGAIDLKAYLPDDILTKVDRATMSVALEARVPILDHRVVQLAAGIPIELKTAGREQKHLLKRLLSRHVPRELWDRPKMGFGIPLAPWLRTSLREWTEDQLGSREGRLHDWIDSRVLRQVLDDHQQCKTDASQLIWACLQLAAWDRRIRSIQNQSTAGQLQVA